jgi:hypothetical protein
MKGAHLVERHRLAAVEVAASSPRQRLKFLHRADGAVVTIIAPILPALTTLLQ